MTIERQMTLEQKTEKKTHCLIAEHVPFLYIMLATFQELFADDLPLYIFCTSVCFEEAFVQLVQVAHFSVEQFLPCEHHFH